jgi:hypothetical protein
MVPIANSVPGPSFIITQQISNVRNWHTALQQDTGERMPKTVRRGTFATDVCKLDTFPSR